MRKGIRTLNREIFLEPDLCIRVPGNSEQRDAQLQERTRVLRIELQHLLELISSFRVPLLPQIAQPDVVPGVLVVSFECESSSERSSRFREQFLLVIEHAERIESFGVVRAQANRTL